ncbi:hypothetical protein [uncultured Clostridium sp.]|nr:hypothetical protein [uncultured Clostridium sp.]
MSTIAVIIICVTGLILGGMGTYLIATDKIKRVRVKTQAIGFEFS